MNGSELASLIIISATVKPGVDPALVEREMDAVMNEAHPNAPTTNVDMSGILRNNGTGGSTKQRLAEGFLPANLYIGGNKTPREVFEEARKQGNPTPDPLRAFSEACRRELQNW